MIAATMFTLSSACSSSTLATVDSATHAIDAHTSIDSHVVTADAPTHHSFAALPLTVPPVRAATPAGLLPAGFRIRPSDPVMHLDPSDLKSRFFSDGPTDIFNILGNIDGSITQMNMFASQNPNNTCLSQTPIEYDLTPFGTTVPFYAQCANGAAGTFSQFGVMDNVTYVYTAGSVGVLAAKITTLAANGAGNAPPPPQADAGIADAGPPDAGTIDALVAGTDAGTPTTQYIVEAWLTVGLNNAASCGNMSGFDDCSYGVMHLIANSATGTFEMAVAGVNIGYCGGQLASDGANIYGEGSLDMGATCVATEDLCVAAADIATAGTCGDTLETFALPPLGRVMTVGPNNTWAASEYPGSADNQITLDGTATDSLNFGPTAPTAGAGTLP